MLLDLCAKAAAAAGKQNFTDQQVPRCERGLLRTCTFPLMIHMQRLLTINVATMPQHQEVNLG